MLISAAVLGLALDADGRTEEAQQPLLPVQQPAPQPETTQVQPAPQPPVPPVTLNASQSAVAQANAELVVTLVRTTLVAVDQANATGNYTVLRDLGAPGFRDKNSAAELAQIFAPIRQQKIDLAPVVLLNPQIAQVNLNNQNMLHIAGALATKPAAVNFELLFQPIAGVWRMYGVAITPAQSPGNVSTAPPNPAAPTTESSRHKAAPRKK